MAQRWSSPRLTAHLSTTSCLHLFPRGAAEFARRSLWNPYRGLQEGVGRVNLVDDTDKDFEGSDIFAGGCDSMDQTRRPAKLRQGSSARYRRIRNLFQAFTSCLLHQLLSMSNHQFSLCCLFPVQVLETSSAPFGVRSNATFGSLGVADPATIQPS